MTNNEIKPTNVLRDPNGRICQGDIVRDVEYIREVIIEDKLIEVTKVNFPLCIVLTQDCDLEQENTHRGRSGNKHDKTLISVLVAPLYNAEHVYLGQHLDDIGIEMEPIKKNHSPGENLRKNERARYHYLEFAKEIPIVPSIIDFKHYFSVNVEYLEKLKKLKFVCKVSELYREDISLRFANYLSRIGLP